MLYCKDCAYFRIILEPIKGVDFGHAVCTKHDLITDFLDHRKFKRLACVEPPKEEE